jgi:hypothetical protein
MKTTVLYRFVAALALLVLAACDKKAEADTSTPSTGSPAPAAAPADKPAEAPAAAKDSKCKQAAEHKAKLKDPSVDPSTLGSVSFDVMDCEGGKWSAGKADCILGAKDYAAAKACE